MQHAATRFCNKSYFALNLKVPRSQIILFEVRHNASNTKITIMFCCKTFGWSKFKIGFKSQPMMTSLRFGIEIACIPTGRLKFLVFLLLDVIKMCPKIKGAYIGY